MRQYTSWTDLQILPLTVATARKKKSQNQGGYHLRAHLFERQNPTIRPSFHRLLLARPIGLAALRS